MVVFSIRIKHARNVAVQPSQPRPTLLWLSFKSTKLD